MYIYICQWHRGPWDKPCGLEAAFSLGCWGNMKMREGKQRLFPCPGGRRQEAAGRHGEPLLGRAGPHLWPAMWSLQICLLYIYCSVSDHRGKTEVPTFTSAHPSVSISTHRSWQAKWLAQGPNGPSWEHQDLHPGPNVLRFCLPSPQQAVGS